MIQAMQEKTVKSENEIMWPRFCSVGSSQRGEGKRRS